MGRLDVYRLNEDQRITESELASIGQGDGPHLVFKAMIAQLLGGDTLSCADAAKIHQRLAGDGISLPFVQRAIGILIKVLLDRNCLILVKPENQPQQETLA